MCENRIKYWFGFFIKNLNIKRTNTRVYLSFEMTRFSLFIKYYLYSDYSTFRLSALLDCSIKQHTTAIRAFHFFFFELFKMLVISIFWASKLLSMISSRFKMHACLFSQNKTCFRKKKLHKALL